MGGKQHPCCAHYALKRTAQDSKETYSQQALETVTRDFYVDDLVKSVDTTAEAVGLTKELTQILAGGGFRLHKWMSNSREVLNTIAESERAVNSVDLDLDELPVQRALGLKWNISEHK